MDVIGYVEFNGEEYGLRKSFSLKTAVAHLNEKYRETEKEEYRLIFDYITKHGYDNIYYVIAIFICIILIQCL